MPRKRLGLLVPSSNTVMEVDFYRHLPPDVTLHTARIFLKETTPEAERRMIDEYTPLAARDLETLRPDLVVFGCTSASAVYGNEGDRLLRDRLAEAIGAPTIGVMSSVQAALARLNARRVAVITPYIDALNVKIAESLAGYGIEVVAIHGLGVTVNREIADVRPEEIAAYAREKLAGTDAECIFASCTNFRAMEALPELRAAFSVPVITSNQAALEAALALLSHRFP